MFPLKKLFIVFCIVLPIGSAKAQTAARDSDYVVNIKGDTIVCRVNRPLFGSVNYSIAGASSVKIEPKTTREYLIRRKDEVYRSVTKKGKSKPLFLRVIESGTICLYEEIITTYSMYGSTTTTVWYVSKGSDVVEQLKLSSLIAFNKQARKTAFEDMLKDNKAAYDKYLANDKKFSFNQIRTLVHFYNTGDWKEKF